MVIDMTLGQLREQLAAIDLPDDSEVMVDEVHHGEWFAIESIEVWAGSDTVRINTPAIGEKLSEHYLERMRCGCHCLDDD